jgi:hypothetical protein
MTHPVTPPPHLLKKFSEQARVGSNKRGGSGYVKILARLCIEWAMNSKPTSNSVPIRSSEITPPPELVQEWCDASKTGEMHFDVDDLATHAAQWGADQELEACCEWLAGWCRDEYPGGIGNLRAARRPKPPSLKEQALETLKYPKDLWSELEVDTIRRALEALPE